MYSAFASLSYSNLIISLCALLVGQGVTTETTRTSPALASVYMTSSLRPSSVRRICTRLFGLGCIGGQPWRTLRMSATVTRLSRILLWAWRIGVSSWLHDRGPAHPKDIPPRCYSPRCLILCAVVALMYSRARGGTSSITRWSSASVSRTSTHSSAYCASLDAPISSICRSLSSIALLWLGVGIPRRIPGPLLARPTSENTPSSRHFGGYLRRGLSSL